MINLSECYFMSNLYTCYFMRAQFIKANLFKRPFILFLMKYIFREWTFPLVTVTGSPI